MAYRIVRHIVALGLATFAVVGSPAQAVTITEGSQLASGLGLDLSGVGTCANVGRFGTNVGSFAGSGRAGSGRASCGNRSTVQVKDDQTPFPFGRFNPDGAGKPWIDSNDLATVSWEVNTGIPLTGFSFALTDAHDQRNSHFTFKVNDAEWSIPTREANGTLHWITVLFDGPVNTASISIRTRRNDGYGISDIKVAPVPLPASLALLAPGLLLLGALGSRRKRTAHSDVQRP